MKIFINPGHGNTDPGVVSKNGIKESDIAATIGTMLMNRLKLNGYPVQYYQQKNGYFEISKEENASGANLFISIHCNGATNPDAHGVEVLYCAGSTKGKELAFIMQQKLIQATGLADRGIKPRTDLHVLNRTKAPAILIETAFLSNTAEEMKLVYNPEIFVNAMWDAIKLYRVNKLI